MYELLTGELPYDVRSVPLPHAVRLICDEPPRRPSSVQKVLRGDLETIVLKAMEKEPSQRYQSASELAGDIRRYLSGESILAQPHSFVYHVRKAVGRNRLAFGFAGLILLVLIGFAITMSVQSIRIAGQRDRAKKAEDSATERLWQSYLSQARALRASGRARQRLGALEAIRKAAAIRPSDELRNEAIAAMALYDVRDKRVLAGAQTYFRFVMSDNGERYACEDWQGEIRVCNVTDDRELFRIPASDVPSSGIRFSPDGNILAATDYRPGNVVSPRIRIWDIWRQRQIVDLHEPLYDDGFENFLLDSNRLITSHPDQTIRISDLRTGSELSRFSIGQGIPNISQSRDGKRLAVSKSSENGVTLWQIDPPERIGFFTLPASPSFSLS